MASQITGVLIVYSTFVQAQIKENIKAPRHWPLWGEFMVTSEFPAQRTSNAENVSFDDVITRLIYYHSLSPLRCKIMYEYECLKKICRSFEIVTKPLYVFVCIALTSHEGEGSNHRQLDCLFNNLPKLMTTKTPTLQTLCKRKPPVDGVLTIQMVSNCGKRFCARTSLWQWNYEQNWSPHRIRNHGTNYASICRSFQLR